MKRGRVSKAEKQFLQMTRGGIRCHSCRKHLSRANMDYIRRIYPVSGIVEHVPTCRGCAATMETQP